jgi:hypothetical protein
MFDVPKKLVVAILEIKRVDIPSILNHYSGISVVTLSVNFGCNQT